MPSTVYYYTQYLWFISMWYAHSCRHCMYEYVRTYALRIAHRVSNQHVFRINIEDDFLSNNSKLNLNYKIGMYVCLFNFTLCDRRHFFWREKIINDKSFNCVPFDVVVPNLQTVKSRRHFYNLSPIINIRDTDHKS